MRIWVRSILALALLAGAAYFIFRRGPDPVEDVRADDASERGIADVGEPGNRVVRPADAVPGDEDGTDSDDNAEPEEDAPPLTEEEKKEAEEEALVEAFDNLTDQWLEPVEKGVSMADVDRFAAAFRKVPEARRDECLHRALNLVPDENVMLLAGILMDKDLGADVVETVFNDILNRDEDVKKPILEQVFKDKTHPCWEDAAWILDVTGELPAAK